LKPVLKPRTVFIEQIRHLLTVYHGRFSLRQFGDFYTAEFGKAESEEIAILLQKGRLPRYGMNVANYSSLKWAVWAPNAYPVPTHRQVTKKSPVPKLSLGGQGQTFRKTLDFDAIQREASNVIDSIDSLRDPEMIITALPSNLPGLSTENTSGACSSRKETLPGTFQTKQESGSAAQTSNIDLSGSNVPHLSSEITGSTNSFDQKPWLDPEFDARSTTVPSLSNICEPPRSSLPQIVDDKDQSDTDALNYAESGMLAVAYNFIKDDPDLLARLSGKPEGTMAAILDTSSMSEEDVKTVTEALNIQRLQDISKPSSLDDNPSGDASRKTEEGHAISGVSVPLPLESTIGGISHETAGPPPLGTGPVDFFEQGLAPDQVLDQLWKLKKDSGGSIKLDQMTPFLDYFGEVSSRELDRIDKLEAQANPQKKTGNGESRKKKRNMAIRFPSQSKATVPPPSLYMGKELSLSDFSIPVGKLPEANFDDLSSDESDEEEAIVKPFNREEFIRKTLGKEGQEFEVPSLSGDTVGGANSQYLTSSFLSNADLNKLSKLDSAVNDLESFLRRDSSN